MDAVPGSSATEPGDTPADMVWIYDPAALRAAIGEEADDGYVGPEDERPAPPPRTSEEEIRARAIHRILDDPRGATRPALHGDAAMAARLLDAVASMPHFAAVTGIIHRAVVQSALTGRPARFPPLLMVSLPGVGKTYYCRRVAEALGTTCVPIAVNGTSDRGQLGGLSPLWRGAKIGKIARGLLVDSTTAAPLYLLDEIDKPPAIGEDERTLDVLLSALEPENARSFTDAYLDAPVDLTSALWLASANDTGAMAAPLLDRMLVLDVPRPTREGARVVAEAIAREVVPDALPVGVRPDALELLLDLAPRRMRRALEMACSFAICALRWDVTAADVRGALALTERADRHRHVGFLPARDGGMG